MTAKEYLLQIAYLNSVIECKKEELARIRELSISVSAIKYEERVQTSGDSDGIVNNVTKIMDIEKELADAIISMIEKRKEILELLGEIKKDIYYQVLYKRYFCFEEFEEIAVDMNYATRHIYRIHGEALNAVQEKLDCQVKNRVI